MKNKCSFLGAMRLPRYAAPLSAKLLLLSGLLLSHPHLRAQQTFIAYDVPAGTAQDQTGLATVSVGMDFDVANEIIVTRLGVFDAGSDGISPGVTLVSRLWDRAQDPPVQIAMLEFTSDDPGELIGSSRFKKLETPIHLAAGFQGTTTGDGWADTDSINNSFGNVANVLWTTHDGNGSIVFVGKSRYGVGPDQYPGTVDSGPEARFASSTFEFQTTPPVLPGKPNVTAKGGDKQIVLTWPAVTQPAPAAKYRVSRADTADGPFTQVAEITETTYTDSTVANGTSRFYIVEGISASGKLGPASDVKTAAAFVLSADHYIAYAVAANVTGNQAYQGPLGMDFDVENPIIVTRLGVFDSKSDGLKTPLDVRIFDRDTQTAVATVSFTTDDPGVLIEGSRFKDLDQPMRLEAGFHGTIEADGYTGDEPLFNSGGNPQQIFWSLNDAKGSLFFLGSSRYGGQPGDFPPNPDSGPAARYAAGTFEFQALPPEFAGVPQVRAIVPPEGGVVVLTWASITQPLPAVKYEILRSPTIDGVYTKVGETTVPNFRDTTVQNGTQYFYEVSAVPASPGKAGISLPLAVTPNAPAGGIAYVVPNGLSGNQTLPANYGIGMDFDVIVPVKITKLGVFDDSSDGLNTTLYAVLYDRATKKPVASQTFTPDNPGELVGGSRFLPLATPLVLDEGFQGSIVIFYTDGAAEKLWNSFGSFPGNQGAHDAAGLTTFGGNSIAFVGGGRYGQGGPNGTGPMPGTEDSGPPDRYAGATFAFEPTVIDHPTTIAYSVPAATTGNQGVKGASIGMDFDVKNDIILTRLGVFDDGSDGIKQLMTARLWDRNETNPAPILVAVLEFTPDSPGQLIAGSRFKPLPEKIRLPKGFQGSISVDYNDNLEKIRNSSGNPANVTWTLNDGNGSIAFVGTGRYGALNGFPGTADGGPAARYASGTFEYQTTPPSVPGTPVVTVQRPFADGSVTLNWLAVTQPLPAAKYEILRGTDKAGPFTKIGETTDITFQDTAVQNGTKYYYIVHALGAGGELGDNSDPVSATPNPIQGGIAYLVPANLAGNQALPLDFSVGMDFDVVHPIKITKLGVFDDNSDGITAPVAAVLFDRATKTALATARFDPDNQGELIGGSRFMTLDPPISLDVGFQGTISMWFESGASERNFNTSGSEGLGGIDTFDGGSILFVGKSRYGAAPTPETFPATQDNGPANRYGAGTFAFEPGSVVTRPTIVAVLSNGKIKLTWNGGGALEFVTALGGTWQPVQGAASGVELDLAGPAKFFRIHQ